jgi:peptidoglycan/LPS O-acetylase OafA/YrhL
VHTTWIWTTQQFELILADTAVGKLTVVGLIALALLGAAVLYHVVEEPARRWMRRMVDVREASLESRANLEPQTARVAPLDVSARAG